MPVVAFVQATNLQELEGRPGLQVIMSFRMEDQVRSLRLEGTVSVTEDFKLGNVEVTSDEIGLGAEKNELLLRAGARGCWNAIFEHDRVAAGFLWRSLRYWMKETNQQLVAKTESSIANRLRNSS
jgi:hypothetical protein